MTMKAPSTLLLRSLLRPQQPLCQIRFKSEWMPREKYAKITSLDKLHRRQKAEVRRERQASQQRAQAMYSDSVAPAPSPIRTPSTQAHSKPAPTLSTLPYLIARTKSSSLPIYETSKSGGTKRITTIRKITGDLAELAAAVRSALRMDEYMTDLRGRRKANVAINHTTKQVVVRGWRAPEIKRWAEMTGF